MRRRVGLREVVAFGIGIALYLLVDLPLWWLQSRWAHLLARETP